MCTAELQKRLSNTNSRARTMVPNKYAGEIIFSFPIFCSMCSALGLLIICELFTFTDSVKSALELKVVFPPHKPIDYRSVSEKNNLLSSTMQQNRVICVESNRALCLAKLTRKLQRKLRNRYRARKRVQLFYDNYYYRSTCFSHRGKCTDHMHFVRQCLFTHGFRL